MIKDVLIPELEKKFGAGSFRIGESPLVVFPAKHQDANYYFWSGPRKRGP